MSRLFTDNNSNVLAASVTIHSDQPDYFLGLHLKPSKEVGTQMLLAFNGVVLRLAQSDSDLSVKFGPSEPNPGPLTQNVWQFLGGRGRTASPEMKGWVNHTTETSASAASTMTAADVTGIQIGRFGGSLDPLDGAIAHIFCFTRGLADAEVAWLIQGNSPSSLNKAGRLFYYPMVDQSLRNVWVPQAGTIGDLTITGSVPWSGDNPQVRPHRRLQLPAGAAAAVGDIAATLPAEFDVVADLRADGLLSGVLPVEFDVIATLIADGKLDAVLPIEFNVVADLKADGLLSGVLPIEFNVVANLLATGLLSAALPIEYNVVADLKADGQLVATLPAEFDVVANLLNATAGDISGILPMEFNVIAGLSNASIPILPFIDRRHIAAFVN